MLKPGQWHKNGVWYRYSPGDRLQIVADSKLSKADAEMLRYMNSKHGQYFAFLARDGEILMTKNDGEVVTVERVICGR
jgi:hypothetical protein